MPFIVSRSDMPSKMFATVNLDNGDAQWIPNRDKATRLTEEQADFFVEEFAKYSDIDLDIEGARSATEPAEIAA